MAIGDEESTAVREDVGRFRRLREVRALWLAESGWSRPLAALVACAEVPWPDSGRFTSEVWVRAASLQAEYAAAVAVGAPDPEAARAALHSYLRVADSVGAVSWATMLRRTLAAAQPELSGVRAAAGRLDSGYVTQGGNLARLERLRELTNSGQPVHEAAAVAFLTVPWLDGVQVPVTLKEFLQGLQPPEADVSAEGLRGLLERLREMAMDSDAVDYVAAADLLLAGLPLEDDEVAAAEADTDDPLSRLLFRPEFSEAVSWLGEAEDSEIVAPFVKQPEEDGRRRLDVDYSSSVPRSLFDPSSFAYRLLVEEAFVATGAETLGEAVDFAASRSGGRLRRALSAVRLEVPLDFGERLVEHVEASAVFKDDRLNAILERRVLAEEPETLESLATMMGVSRERVRQLQKQVEESLEVPAPAVERAGFLLRSALGDRTERAEFEAALERVVPGDGTRSAVRIARLLVTRVSGYRLTATAALSQELSKHHRTFASLVDSHTDERGFVDEDSVWAALNVDQDVKQALVARHDTVRICGYLMRRDTQKCRVYAAFRSLGEPATPTELSEHLGDFAFEHLTNVLSAAPDVVKATKAKWGLREWVDRPYEGIVQEIAFRVEQNGGLTTVEQLMRELPDRYDVSETSVNMYLGTPRFDVRNGEVRLATKMRSRHVPLDRLDSVVFASSGRPLLAVVMEERYLSGYSINVPQAVAEYLGVGLDESVRIRVVSPRGCEAVSVIWRSHAVTGPHIGRVREALTKLGVAAGDTFYIKLNRAGVAFLDALPPDAGHRPPATAVDDETEASVSAVIERMRSRRQL